MTNCRAVVVDSGGVHQSIETTQADLVPALGPVQQVGRHMALQT